MDLSNIAVIFQVIIVFGLIVFVHELGHFLAAKWAGVGVERFLWASVLKCWQADR